MKKKMRFPAIIMIIMSVLPVSGQVTLSVDTVRTMALEHSYNCLLYTSDAADD